ncbi:MAG: guanylate kinase, partial [Lachnospiraceae bacterium]|nr:guanylate kinase [Lachnospiraceae bacterium]
TPPSAKEQKERLIGRNTEDIGTINKRMKRAIEESEFMSQYEYIAVNDQLDVCVEELHKVINDKRTQGTAGNREMDYQALIQKIKSELIALEE